MSDMTNTDRADRLEEIKDEMLELLREARRLVRGTSEENRARVYWLAHIRTALDDDHEYAGGSMCTLASTIEALEQESEAPDEDDEDGDADAGVARG